MIQALGGLGGGLAPAPALVLVTPDMTRCGGSEKDDGGISVGLNEERDEVGV